MSQKVHTSFEDLIGFIKLLPIFPPRLEFRLVKKIRALNFNDLYWLQATPINLKLFFLFLHTSSILLIQTTSTLE